MLSPLRGRTVAVGLVWANDGRLCFQLGRRRVWELELPDLSLQMRNFSDLVACLSSLHRSELVRRLRWNDQFWHRDRFIARFSLSIFSSSQLAKACDSAVETLPFSQCYHRFLHTLTPPRAFKW